MNRAQIEVWLGEQGYTPGLYAQCELLDMLTKFQDEVMAECLGDDSEEDCTVCGDPDCNAEAHR